MPMHWSVLVVLSRAALIAGALLLGACAQDTRRAPAPVTDAGAGKPQTQPRSPSTAEPSAAPQPQAQAPKTAPSSEPAPRPARVSVNALEQKVVEATNVFRRENQLGALKPNVRLVNIAQGHARNMAAQDKFGDTDKNGHVLDGRGVEARIKTGAYAYGRVAENVGYQLHRQDPAASMMEAWKASPGHRRNMLLADVNETGVGAAQGKSGRWYFVQLFGRPPDGPQTTRTSQ